VSDPKRMTVTWKDLGGGETGKTKWVSLAEYKLLEAEVERLKNNVAYLDTKLDEELDKSAMLCGQIERLTKAGDLVFLVLRKKISVFLYVVTKNRWNAAKAGKPGA